MIFIAGLLNLYFTTVRVYIKVAKIGAVLKNGGAIDGSRREFTELNAIKADQLCWQQSS